MCDKSEKFSVSFPTSLRAAMDRHIGNKPRSQYLQEIAEADLRKHNALTNDPVAAEMDRVRELIETRGLVAVRAKLDELALAVAAGEFEERQP